MTEIILLSVRQHIIKYFLRLPRWVFIAAVLAALAWLFASSWAVGIIVFVLVFVSGLILEWKRYTRSTLDITNTRVYLQVSKGIMSGFEAGLHYRQIKNCAFRKQHLLHTLSNSGTIFLRAGGDENEQIVAEYVPNVEKISRSINWMLSLNEEARIKLQEIPKEVMR